MSENNRNRPITEWAEDDRPREKLLLKGKSALSNAELIAILLGSGNRKLSAVDLAREIMKYAGDSLIELSRCSVQDLTSRFKGVGTAKAVSIVAALELGRRRQASKAVEKKSVRSSRDAYEHLAPYLADLNWEEFRILLLNNANRVIANLLISKGGFTGAAADPRIIFKEALQHNAVGIILAHNHPSGNLKPSEADKKLTNKLFKAGKYLDINVLDHIIVVHDTYLSFTDEGLFS